MLRKSGEHDHRAPGAYRPISLLNTLSTILWALVAKELLHWHRAGLHMLLPETQFREQPGRNTEQALLVRTIAVDRTLLHMRSKEITPAAFDVRESLTESTKN